jgi:hypothetical protein
MHRHALLSFSLIFQELPYDLAIYKITQRQPAPPSSPELLARMEPLLPVLPAPSASSSSRSAGLTVMWTTLGFWRAKGRSKARLVEFVAIYWQEKFLTFQVNLIINHPPHDDQANAARIPGSILPL